MKRPVVEFPYEEDGQKKQKFIIAQPPQKLFTVILNETEEQALGLAGPSIPALEETEADRWARELSERDVCFPCKWAHQMSKNISI